MNTRHRGTFCVNGTQIQFRSLVSSALAVAMALIAHSSVQAQIDWNNSTGTPSPWLNATGNWDGGLLPGSADTARFSINGDYEVWWNSFAETAVPTVNEVEVRDGNVTFLNRDAAPQRTLNTTGFGIWGVDTSLTLRGMHLNSIGGFSTINEDASLTVDGSHSAGSLLTAQTGTGFRVLGNLDVVAGGQVQSTDSVMRLDAISSTPPVANVNGAGSVWNNTGRMVIGDFGESTLNIGDGGQVNTQIGVLGDFQADGRVNVSDSGSQFNVSEDLIVGENSRGSIAIENGGAVTTAGLKVGSGSDGDGQIFVDGAGSQLTSNAATSSIGDNGEGELNVDGGGTVALNFSADIGTAAGSKGTVAVQGADSQVSVADTLRVGNSGSGTVNVQNGGAVSAGRLSVGSEVVSLGNILVEGAGSRLDVTQDMTIGLSGRGQMQVADQGVVNTTDAALVGVGSTSLGNTVTVEGSGSAWNVATVLRAGFGGEADVTVSEGGLLTSNRGQISTTEFSNAAVTVRDAGSRWLNATDLAVGNDDGGSGTLSIANDGLVSVGGTTSIGNFGEVNLDGGRFEFGETSLSEFAKINATSGSMAGDLIHSGFTDAASLTSMQNTAVDLTDVRLTNSGTLFGNASLGVSVTNDTAGEISAVVGERLRFAGSADNAGQVNNFGGQIRFDQRVNNRADGEINNFGGQVITKESLSNEAGGFVGGRGQFMADGGFVNEGVMAFSAGEADILGDVVNRAGGQIVTSGGATTTFFDDVEHNGAEIRTTENATTVIFGLASGAGAYTGTGDVFFEGDLRPGNSPALVDFEGDVFLGSTSELFAELGGIGIGEFDQMSIIGDLSLAGDLDVSLLSGFDLGLGMEFLIADVGGSLSGQFNGLGENDLVGNFGGQDLFISYSGGDGNDVRLFTVAVPEPGAASLLMIGACGLILRRKRLS